MIVVSRDAEWERVLRTLCARSGWMLESRRDLSPSGKTAYKPVAVVVDRSLFAGGVARGVAGLRALHPTAVVILALTASEMTPESIKEALDSGVDDVIAKGWTQAKLTAKLAVFFDQALAAEVRVSADGGLKAEKRSHRAYAYSRKNWKDLMLHPAEFALLWRLLAQQGQVVSREELLAALKSSLDKDFEAETVARRVLTLRKALSCWKSGRVESVRGGFYRLISDR